MPPLLSLSTLVLQNKKVLQQDAYLPPAPVISAFSFFVCLLEFLLLEQKATKDQFLRTALYVTIKKFLPGFYQTNRFCDRAIRCVPSSKSGDLCFFLLPFSFRVSSTRTRSNIKRSISETALHASITKSLFAFVQIVNKLIFNNREQARRNVNKRCNKIRLKYVLCNPSVTELNATLHTANVMETKAKRQHARKDNNHVYLLMKYIFI